MKTLTFRVTARVPDEVSAAEMKVYIYDAVTSWGGQFHPDDPLFGLSDDQIGVVGYRPRSKQRKINRYKASCGS